MRIVYAVLLVLIQGPDDTPERYPGEKQTRHPQPGAEWTRPVYMEGDDNHRQLSTEGPALELAERQLRLLDTKMCGSTVIGVRVERRVIIEPQTIWEVTYSGRKETEGA